MAEKVEYNGKKKKVYVKENKEKPSETPRARKERQEQERAAKELKNQTNIPVDAKNSFSKDEKILNTILQDYIFEQKHPEKHNKKHLDNRLNSLGVKDEGDNKMADNQEEIIRQAKEKIAQTPLSDELKLALNSAPINEIRGQRAVDKAVLEKVTNNEANDIDAKNQIAYARSMMVGYLEGTVQIPDSQLGSFNSYLFNSMDVRNYNENGKRESPEQLEKDHALRSLAMEKVNDRRNGILSNTDFSKLSSSDITSLVESVGGYEAAFDDIYSDKSKGSFVDGLKAEVQKRVSEYMNTGKITKPGEKSTTEADTKELMALRKMALYRSAGTLIGGEEGYYNAVDEKTRKQIDDGKIEAARLEKERAKKKIARDAEKDQSKKNKLSSEIHDLGHQAWKLTHPGETRMRKLADEIDGKFSDKLFGKNKRKEEREKLQKEQEANSKEKQKRALNSIPSDMATKSTKPLDKVQEALDELKNNEALYKSFGITLPRLEKGKEAEFLAKFDKVKGDLKTKQDEKTAADEKPKQNADSNAIKIDEGDANANVQTVNQAADAQGSQNAQDTDRMKMWREHAGATDRDLEVHNAAAGQESAALTAKGKSASKDDAKFQYDDANGKVSFQSKKQEDFDKLVEIAKKEGKDAINFGSIQSDQFKAMLMVACLRNSVEMQGEPKFEDLKNLDKKTVEDYKSAKEKQEKLKEAREKVEQKSKYQELLDDHGMKREDVRAGWQAATGYKGEQADKNKLHANQARVMNKMKGSEK